MTTPYADKEDWAKKQNYDTWADYTAANPDFPKLSKLNDDLDTATEILNQWIGSDNVSITDVRYTAWLKKKALAIVDRIHDEEINRRSDEPRNIYQPHDYLYEHERNKCIQIGVATGYRVAGGTAYS